MRFAGVIEGVAKVHVIGLGVMDADSEIVWAGIKDRMFVGEFLVFFDVLVVFGGQSEDHGFFLLVVVGVVHKVQPTDPSSHDVVSEQGGGQIDSGFLIQDKVVVPASVISIACDVGVSLVVSGHIDNWVNVREADTSDHAVESFLLSGEGADFGDGVQLALDTDDLLNDGGQG